MNQQNIKKFGQTTKSENHDLGGKYLSFFLENEEYGLQILKVIEIIGIMKITKIPHAPAFIRGIINLRGKVIPVIDMRLKFGLPPQAKTEETVIIVVQVLGIEMGIIVDQVSEVLDIAGEHITSSPSFGVDINTDFILGICKADDSVKLLLDIDHVLSTQDVIALKNAQAFEVDNGNHPKI